jgi:hypothetical protein
MSDSGQGGGERSWWEKPDQEPAAQDPYRATSGDSPDADAHDPYRVPPVEPGGGGATRVRPGDAPVPPTEALPQHGQPQPGSPSPYAPPPSSWQDRPPYPGAQGAQPAGPQHGEQHGAPQYGAPQYGSPQHGGQPYPSQQHANQQYPDPYGGYGYQQPPVTGMAHAVLWTAVGGLVLSFTGLGWIAAIVALALTPGARREILESGGAKRGLGFLLAGKICAWVNIGLTVLAVVGLAILIGLGADGAFDDTSSFDSNGLNTVFTP